MDLRRIKRYFNDEELDLILQLLGDQIEVRDRAIPKAWARLDEPGLHRNDVIKIFTKLINLKKEKQK